MNIIAADRKIASIFYKLTHCLSVKKITKYVYRSLRPCSSDVVDMIIGVTFSIAKFFLTRRIRLPYDTGGNDREYFIELWTEDLNRISRRYKKLLFCLYLIPDAMMISLEYGIGISKYYLSDSCDVPKNNAESDRKKETGCFIPRNRKGLL